MSLDLSLTLEVGSVNCTHNLTTMADNVPAGIMNVWDSETKGMVNREITLYEAMWRPDEVGIYNGSDLMTPLQAALEFMITNREALIEYNPENNWGNYEGLVEAVREMGKHCMMFPHARVECDR